MILTLSFFLSLSLSSLSLSLSLSLAVLNFGINLQKNSLKYGGAVASNYCSRPRWLGGLTLYAVGNLMNVGALVFASQALLAPIGSFALGKKRTGRDEKRREESTSTHPVYSVCIVCVVQRGVYNI